MSPFIAEIVGTMLLILLGSGVVANVVLKHSKGFGADWIVITVGWGLAVFVGVVVAGPYSGAHINPAVTIGLATSGAFPWSDVPQYLFGQMLGAVLGCTISWLAYRDHYNATEDPDAILATFSTSPGIRNYRWNLVTEAIGTFVLVFVVLYFVEPEIKGRDFPEVNVGLGSLGAIPVSLLVISIGLSLGGPTGYAINPARDLGPRIMHSLLPIKHKGTSDWKYSWVPIMGPIIGAGIAGVLYLTLSSQSEIF